MIEDLAFWTIAPTTQACAAVSEMAASARNVGLFKPIHVWARQQIECTTLHELGDTSLRGGHYRLTLLPQLAAATSQEYFVWLDPNTSFERNPGTVLEPLQGGPIHVPLTFDLESIQESGPVDWHGCPRPDLARLMREAGIRNRVLYAASCTFFIVHRHVIPAVLQLTQEFKERAAVDGWNLPVEPLMAYAMQMLCADPEAHCVLSSTSGT